jgi:predicted ATPase
MKAKSQGARLWELRTAMNLAEMWRAKGDDAAAFNVLAPVYRGFTEGINAADLVAARQLLGQLGECAMPSESRLPDSDDLAFV